MSEFSASYGLKKQSSLNSKLCFVIFATLVVTANSSRNHHFYPAQSADRSAASANQFFFKPSELSDQDYNGDDYFNEYEDNHGDHGFNGVNYQIKRVEENINDDPLIQVFKLKLLELLGVDEVPDPLEYNIKSKQLSEAIYKQHMLVREKTYKRVKNGRILKHRFRLTHSRPLRSKLVDPADNEHIRFNSSVTKQITLMTNKIIDESQNKWCHEKTHNSQFESLISLSCFKFPLQNEAFKESIVNSAKLYFKLDQEAINQALSEPLLMIQPTAYLNRTAYLYIEANGFLIKRIDLTRINNIQEPFVFKHVEIKHILEDILDYDHTTALRIRFLAGHDLISLAHSVLELKETFASMDETMALNVRFGEVTNKPASNRKKRELLIDRSAPEKPYYKTTRDCSDLRKAGSNPSNFTCCRETLSVTMEQLGWSHWILSPKVIQYKYCRGSCMSGSAPRYDNTHIIYRMFELSNTLEAAHCCNIYDYEKPITFIYGEQPNYKTRVISLNAKNCLCS